MQSVRCSVFVRAGTLLALAALVAGALAGPVSGAQPTATPLPLPSEQPVAPGSGQATAGSTVPSCGAAGPGAITVSVADVRVAVLYADAGEPSDLQLSSPTQRTLIPDATHNHSPVSVGAYGLPASLVVSIYTPYFGTTHSSTSTYAKVLAESPGVWMICFEDGVDGDYNDLVVRVWNDSCSSQSFTDFVTEPVRVRYDPRFLSSPADIDFATKALWMAQGISDRATSALSTYTTMMGRSEPGATSRRTSTSTSTAQSISLASSRSRHLR